MIQVPVNSTYYYYRTIQGWKQHSFTNSFCEWIIQITCSTGNVWKSHFSTFIWFSQLVCTLHINKVMLPQQETCSVYSLMNETLDSFKFLVHLCDGYLRTFTVNFRFPLFRLQSEAEKTLCNTSTPYPSISYLKLGPCYWTFETVRWREMSKLFCRQCRHWTEWVRDTIMFPTTKIFCVFCRKVFPQHVTNLWINVIYFSYFWIL